MAIDEGTTSTRAMIIDHQGRKIASSQNEFPQYFPQPGWVEHKPEEIWHAVQTTIANAIINSGVDRKSTRLNSVTRLNLV